MMAGQRSKNAIAGQDTGQTIARELSRQMVAVSGAARCTKRTAARLAIVNVIRANVVSPGELLPSEKELTSILGVSLGTVQAALRQLSEMGTIVRRRGDGTRVTALEPLGETIWHFRFASKSDGTPLRFTDLEVWTDTISDPGIWSDYLGEKPHYLRIRRQVTMQNGAVAGAEMYLDAQRVAGLEKIDAFEMKFTNIRPYLEEKFGLITKGATHFVRTIEPDTKTRRIFDLRRPGEYYEIHAKAYSDGRHPVYFQRIYISTSDCALMF
jgi:DNA-binding GntR family transcriptional regulator